MNLETLPLWLQLPMAALLVVGAVFALVGVVGLLRFPDFFMRLHAPTKANMAPTTSSAAIGS